MNDTSTKSQIMKVFDQSRNLGKIIESINGIDLRIRHFTLIDGKEVFCEDPDEASYDSNESSQLELFPSLKKEYPVETEIIEESPEKKEIYRAINSVLLQDQLSKRDSNATLEQLEQATPSIETPFFKRIDNDSEFGISRLVSDRIYHLPRLLESPSLISQEGTDVYIISSSISDSSNGTIEFEHRLLAPNEQIAQELASKLIEKMRGILQKIWMATWKLANELKKFNFTCDLTDLMRLTYPDRSKNVPFEPHEKLEFYENLRSLENTKILYKRSTKKGETHSIELRLLEIHHTKQTRKEYPKELSIIILNAPYLQNEKMAFVGAAYKNTTLSLNVDDISLASWLQARISQLKESGASSISCDENYLFVLSRLEKTATTNKSRARSLLTTKLNRLIDHQLIKDFQKPFGRGVNPSWTIFI